MTHQLLDVGGHAGHGGLHVRRRPCRQMPRHMVLLPRRQRCLHETQRRTSAFLGDCRKGWQITQLWSLLRLQSSACNLVPETARLRNVGIPTL